MASEVEFFLDTNVLLYALSRADAEAGKRRLARDWVNRRDWGLSTQVLMEFYVNAIRPRHGVAAAIAGRLVARFASSRPVQAFDTELALAATAWQQDFNLSLWDAAILCAAKRLGARTVVSEDLAHGQSYRGVRVLNPFLGG